MGIYDGHKVTRIQTVATAFMGCAVLSFWLRYHTRESTLLLIALRPAGDILLSTGVSSEFMAMPKFHSKYDRAANLAGLLSVLRWPIIRLKQMDNR